MDDAEFVEHIGRCSRCRETFLKLSADTIDWRQWRSLLQATHSYSPAAPGQAGEAPPVTATRACVGRRNADTVQHHSSRIDEVPYLAPDCPEAILDVAVEGREFGDYELLDQLGAGGMGIVYRARHRGANRIVALKLIRPERLELLPPDQRQSWLDRFRSEAVAAACLEHDNVATVYEVGDVDGTPYYSMQYIKGRSLANIIDDGPLENYRAARIICSVAHAVEHAHSHAILHRDLKPQNVLIRQVSSSADGSVGEVKVCATGPASRHIADGDERAYVVDFGLAKSMEAGLTGVTHTGDVIGTPSYMSPEQVKDSSRCAATTDVYGLGATLYEALTGRPPFRCVSTIETLKQILDQEPVRPRDLNPSIDLDLETITLKALAKEPARRYGTAAAMADDLQRYINHEPIAARPVGTIERSLRWCGRNPAIASLAAGVTSLLVLVAVGSVVYSVRLTQYSQREHVARTEAESYLQLTLSAIDEMLTTVGEASLKHVPQMEGVRKSLLKKALDLHHELLKSQPSDPALQLEFGRAQHRMGDIYVLLGEHAPAKVAYSRAIQLCQDLETRRAADPQVQHCLAISLTSRGELFRKSKPQDAVPDYRQALKIQENLCKLEPENEEYRRELSRTLNNFGLLLTDIGQYDEAEAKLRSAIGNLKAFASRHGAPTNIISDLGRSQINLGFLLRRQTPRAREAEAAFRDAVNHLRMLAESEHANRDYQYRLAVALLDLGHQLKDRAGGSADAVACTREANAKLRKLREDFPETPLYWYELANSHNSLANTLLGLDDIVGVKQELRHANSVLDEMSDRFPAYARNVADYQSLKGIVLGGLGAVALQLEKEPDLQESQRFIEHAIGHQKNAVKVNPANPVYAERLSAHYSFLALILDKRGVPLQAKKQRLAAASVLANAGQMQAE